jgi:hypothetical protein
MICQVYRVVVIGRDMEACTRFMDDARDAHNDGTKPDFVVVASKNMETHGLYLGDWASDEFGWVSKAHEHARKTLGEYDDLEKRVIDMYLRVSEVREDLSRFIHSLEGTQHGHRRSRVALKVQRPLTDSVFTLLDLQDAVTKPAEVRSGKEV